MIINVAKYSNPECFQIITFGSALHHMAGQFASFNVLLPKCWYFPHVFSNYHKLKDKM